MAEVLVHVLKSCCFCFFYIATIIQNSTKWPTVKAKGEVRMNIFTDKNSRYIPLYSFVTH